MASLKNLTMFADIVKNEHIDIRKSFFGLREKYYFNQTGSELEVKQIEFTTEAGKQLEVLLKTPINKLADTLADCGKIQQRPMSNVRLDICVSKDRQFLALQLFNYYDLMFHPVTGVRVLEGKNAQLMANAVLTN
ncbi:MAG: hypothetical protein IJR07_09080 [Bacteroidaceae bacterium]|nr:hypothetical protein [Bacteroidaceae bacterium]